MIRDSRINVSGLCNEMSVPGLSRASLLNKMNDNHPHNLTEKDEGSVKCALKKLSDDILREIK